MLNVLRAFFHLILPSALQSVYHCCFHFTHEETKAQRGKENFPKATGVGSQHLILNPSLIAEPTLFQLLCHTTSCTYMFCLPSYATQLQSIITAPGPAAGSVHRRGELWQDDGRDRLGESVLPGLLKPPWDPPCTGCVHLSGPLLHTTTLNPYNNPLAPFSRKGH